MSGKAGKQTSIPTSPPPEVSSRQPTRRSSQNLKTLRENRILFEAKSAAIYVCDGLDAEQDDHGVRSAAPVIGREARPESERSLFPEDVCCTVQQPFVWHSPLAVGFHVLR